MTSSLYTSVPQRGNGLKETGRLSHLPSFSSAIHEKKYGLTTRSSALYRTYYVQIPGVRDRQLRIPVPIPSRLYQWSVLRFGRKRGSAVLLMGVFAILWIVFAFTKRFGTHDKKWPTPFQDTSTLVYGRGDLKRIWEWEIASGHYPSHRHSEFSLWAHCRFHIYHFYKYLSR